VKQRRQGADLRRLREGHSAPPSIASHRRDFAYHFVAEKPRAADHLAVIAASPKL